MGKKIIFTLSAAALLGVNLCAAGIASGSNVTTQVKAEGASAVVYDFEGDDPFKDWSISTDQASTVTISSFDGLLSDSSGTFWENPARNFYANGSKFLNMYNGNADWKGTITSPSFTLGGDGYISALIGGGQKFHLLYRRGGRRRQLGRASKQRWVRRSEPQRKPILQFHSAP